MPAERERWWDQRVHFPPPPPSLPPSTPLLVVATTSDESAVTNNKDDTPEYTADEQSARLCAVLEALYIEHPIGMRNMQALSLVSRGLQVGVRSLLSTATVARLHGPTDFSFATAAFVTRRLPAVRRIVTEGSDVDVARIRERAAAGEDVCVADFGEAALLVGTLLAATISDGTLVMSDGRKLSLRALRESRRVRLRGVRGVHGLHDADLASLLGALSLNTHLDELCLCANPAPNESWAVDALAAAVRRERVLIRHHRILGLPGIVRAALRPPPSGAATPSWLVTHGSEEKRMHADEEQGEEYAVPLTEVREPWQKARTALEGARFMDALFSL